MTRRQPGFTLLEVLIAVAVLGTLILLLNQGVAFGLRANITQQRAETRHGDLEAVDRAIRQLIAQAYPGTSQESVPFSGTASSLTLVSELPAASDGRRQPVDARLFVANAALRLRWTPRRHVTLFGPQPAPQELVLLNGVSALQFAYFNGANFTTSWSGERLPVLVRVTLRFQDENRKWPPIEVAPAREALDQ